MTIEIHKPELKGLILERMKSGEFQDVEDLLMQALRSLARGDHTAARKKAKINLAPMLFT